MINDAEQRLVSQSLFQLLLKKEEKENFKLSERIKEILRECMPLLERIPENMPEFTLHDPNHGAKVVEIMGKIIPVEVLAEMNHIEIALLILSGYLHDIGMTCTKDEKEDFIRNSDEFKMLFKSDVINYHSYHSHLNNKEYREATFIEDQIFTEYLRQNHVRRSANFIREKLGKGELTLSVNSINFCEHLISICDGHGLAVNVLRDLDSFPRNTLIGDKIVNIQYLSLILRLADILDLDSERTPKLIYEYINPKDPISIIEWKKHRSNIGHSITAKRVLFESKCNTPEVERALREFIGWIEIERRETLNLLREYTDEISKKYFLTLTEEILDDRIKNDGSYIYNDLKFTIDYKRVIELLIGERLYKSPIVSIRELIQNSVDAIKIRSELYKNRSESFRPFIKITLSGNNFSIEDNGIGMDHYVFKNFFLQAGKSFYSSKEFYSKYAELDPVSEFGIGILSVFMIANSLIIESRKEPDNPLCPPLPIHFEIPTAYSFTIERKSSRFEIGTKLTLVLKDSATTEKYDLIKVIQEIIPNSPFEIIIKINDAEEILHKNTSPKSFRELPEIVGGDIGILPNIRTRSSDEKVYEWLKIDFSISSNPVLKNIEGFISIVDKVGAKNTSGKICQRGFAIGYPSIEKNKFQISIPANLNSLFPYWLCMHIDINLTKNACLNISPDRTDVVVDEKYFELQNLIEKEIIDSIAAYFRDYKDDFDEFNFINFQEYFFNSNFFHFSYDTKDSFLSSAAIDFFSNLITFRCLDFDQEVKILSIEQLKKIDNLGVVSDHWHELKIESYEYDFLKKYQIRLVLFTVPWYWTNDLYNLFYKILTGKYRSDSDFNLTIQDLLPKFYFDLIRYFEIEKYQNKNQFICLEEPQKEILFQIDEGLFEITIDKTNEIFKDLPKDFFKKNESVLYDLQIGINNILTEALQKLSDTDLDVTKAVLKNFTSPYSFNFYPLFKNIFERTGDLSDDLDNCISSFFEDLIEEEVLPADFDIPELSENNFLSYWGKFNLLYPEC